MATADEIRARIMQLQQELQRETAAEQRALQEVNEAKLRQKLRREQDEVEERLNIARSGRCVWQGYRQQIDADQEGPHLPGHVKAFWALESSDTTDGARNTAVHHSTDCNIKVRYGELEWSIKGFSWLQAALKQNDLCYAQSSLLRVCDHKFILLYRPDKGEMGDFGQRGSLVIHHEEPGSVTGIAFRYKLWIKQRGGSYVQWGTSATICMTEDADGMLFGPDVCGPSGPKTPCVPGGIFGMSHADLIESEWVTDDVLTVKLEIELRPRTGFAEHEACLDIAVPPPNLGEKLLLLLNSGKAADVTFTVQAQEIRAHSPILTASSEVFERLLSCGMQESKSKRVSIEDCEPETFKAFLQYVYSESFGPLEDFLAKRVAQPPHADASSSAAPVATVKSESRADFLQQLLGLSHKYQVARLQLWCERELSSCISIEDVCSVLRLAHVYEAQKLEEKCLDFIKTHMNEVVKTDAYGSLSQDWPQVSLKITLHVAGVEESSAAAAIEKQESRRKRKRSE